VRTAIARLARLAAIAVCMALVIWGFASRRGRRPSDPSPSNARAYLASIASPDALLRDLRAFDVDVSTRTLRAIEVALRDPDLAFGLVVQAGGGGKRSFVEWLRETRVQERPLAAKLAEALLVRAREGPTGARAPRAIEALAALADRIPATFASEEARALVRVAASGEGPGALAIAEIPDPGWIEDLLQSPESVEIVADGGVSPADGVLLAAAALARIDLPLPPGIAGALARAIKRPACASAAPYAAPPLARTPTRAWDAPWIAALLDRADSPDRPQAAEAAAALYLVSGIALDANDGGGPPGPGRTAWQSLIPPPQAWLDPQAISAARAAWRAWWEDRVSKDPRDALLEAALSGSAPRDRAALWEIEILLGGDPRAAGPWLVLAGPRLVAALSASLPPIRRAAARLLGIKRDAGPLAARLRAEKEREVRKEILRALAAAWGDGFAAEAIAMAADLDEETAWRALDRVVLAGGRDAAAARFADAFRTGSAPLRARLAAVLPRVGAAGAAPTLLAGLGDEEAQVRFWSDRSLRDLAGGFDAGYRHDADPEARADAAARWRREAARRGWVPSGAPGISTGRSRTTGT